MFNAIGLDEDSELVYEALLEPDSATAREAVQRTDLSLARVQAALRRLEAAELVRRDHRDPRPPKRYVAVDPGISVSALIYQQEEALKRAALHAKDLAARFQRAASSQDPTQLIEIVTGVGAIGERLLRVERSARKEIRVLDRPPYHGQPVAESSGELEFLRRGGAVRAIYARGSLEVAGRLVNIEDIVVEGEQARLLPDLPTKLLLADDETAILPLRAGPDLSPSFVVIHRSALLEALAGLFEVLWRLAVPVLPPEPMSVAASVGGHPNQLLLALLIAGLPDESIARELGISYRTLQRRVHALMDSSQSVTRFQLGVQAERRGWLHPGSADGESPHVADSSLPRN